MKVHPGEYIREEIKARGWNMPYRKRRITLKTAKELAEVFNVPAEFFINLQKEFDK